MSAAPIIEDWKRRLVAMADHPPYVFRDTHRSLIDEHHRRLTTFTGFPRAEVGEVESRLGVRFPAVFREFLLQMAKSPGALFAGSDLAGLQDLDRFQADALELLRETDPSLSLPPAAVVFLIHQGYAFLYVLAVGGFDGPPMQWTEMAPEPRPVAATFAEMVDAELRLMEDNDRKFRDQGGYWLTLLPGGGATQSHPALASGERPLDQVHRE